VSVVSRSQPQARGLNRCRVIQLDSGDPRWDAFVRAAPGATVFHHSGWLTALEQEGHQPSLRLACEEPDGTLSGILPLIAARGLPLGLGGHGTSRRLSSLPRTPVAGPIALSEPALQALIKTAMALAQSSGMRLQLKQTAGALDNLVPGLQSTQWRMSYVKALPRDPEQLTFRNGRNRASINRAVRKAQREGLRVREAASVGDLRAWYRLYLELNRWRRLPPRPYRLFRVAWEQLRAAGHFRLLLVHGPLAGRDVLLAGSITLMLGDTAFYAFNGRLTESLPLRPNDLLQWHALRDAAASGYRWYDFGEVSEGNEGLARFKAKWGTEERRLARYYAPPLPAAAGGYHLLDARGPGHRIATTLWRKMPLPVTALAGDLAYRFL
jgi:Acetyltransferase (GNAT) domain